MGKTSEDEVRAALEALTNARVHVSYAHLRAALEAARQVRKAAKKAKAPRQKPAQGEPVFELGDRVKHAKLGFGTVVAVDTSAAGHTCLVRLIVGTGRGSVRHVWLRPEDLSPAPVKPARAELVFKVGDRVTHAKWGGGEVLALDTTDFDLPYMVRFANDATLWPRPKDLSPAPVGPAQAEPVFEAGKVYVTRDGRVAEVTGTQYHREYPLVGCCGGVRRTWSSTGRIYVHGPVSPDDIVGPWPVDAERSGCK